MGSVFLYHNLHNGYTEALHAVQLAAGNKLAFLSNVAVSGREQQIKQGHKPCDLQHALKI